MSNKIIILDRQLANQIAAGEVVERPLSVVKELVENSIDARATKVDIYLEESGIQAIRVQDDGEGISSKDLSLALEKYATSKISNLEDLYSVKSFGFRGEALASIASVSEFSISSKPPTSVSGSRVISSGGSDVVQDEVACPKGTSVEVNNIFFNTPARLHYLKTPRTEYLKIQESIQKMSLAYPQIGFSLWNNGKQTLQFSKGQKLEDRIYEIYGEMFRENMLEVSHEFNGIHISGYISDPKTTFSNKNRQNIFINKRSISSPIVYKAIQDAYNRFIPHGSFSAYIFFIELDPTRVDVNVHPRKLEVRFADEQSVFRSVYHSVKNKLEEVSMVSLDSSSSGSFDTFVKEGKAPEYYTGSGTKFKNYSPYKNTQANPAQSAIHFSRELLQGKENTQEGPVDLYETPIGRIIGQVHNSYIVVQTVEGIKILDQHAVAERVIYEKLAAKSYQMSSQKLLGGVGLHLVFSELEVLTSYKESLEKMGFEFEFLSAGNIMLHSVPDFIKKENIEQIFKKILSDISQLGSVGLDEVLHKIWAFVACRSAIKFGDPLSIFEMHALLRDASMDYSSTCPHGRPVVYDISLNDLQKKYER